MPPTNPDLGWFRQTVRKAAMIEWFLGDPGERSTNELQKVCVWAGGAGRNDVLAKHPSLSRSSLSSSSPDLAGPHPPSPAYPGKETLDTFPRPPRQAEKALLSM